ncbi:MAG: polysaccharide deacetylase family protein [Fibrobacteria bacterium]|nr:polysaccharide deacetylase family protein [Fibrobacteria bacterium]
MKRKTLLTIDDSPSPLMDQRLEFLRQLDIRIVWFCRGDNLTERPESAIRALREGHILGNHSWDHPYFSTLSLADAADQIDRTEALLERIHLVAGVPRTVRCFRFPYEDQIGSAEHHQALQEMLAARGFEASGLRAVTDPRFRRRAKDLSWFWSYDLEDWTLRSSDAPDAAPTLQRVLERLTRELPQRPSGLEVVVGHDHAHTVGQWEATILRLLDLDCEFVSLEEARALTPPARKPSLVEALP